MRTIDLLLVSGRIFRDRAVSFCGLSISGKQFLPGSRYARRPNPNSNPGPNPGQKQAIKTAAPLFLLIFRITEQQFLPGTNSD